MTVDCRSMMRLIHVAKPDEALLPTCALVIALLLGAALVRPAGAQVLQALDLVKQAVEAVGGIDALRSLKRIAIKGEVRHWEPEESYVAGGPPVFTDRSIFAVAWGLGKGVARTHLERAIQFPAGPPHIFSEIVPPGLGYADAARPHPPSTPSTLPPQSTA